MNILILLAIAAGLIAIQLVASRFVKLNRLAWMALWWVALYLVFNYGIAPPLPSSIVVLFMAIVTLALLAYLSADSEELEEAKQAIENFLVEKKHTVPLLIVVVVVPLLVVTPLVFLGGSFYSIDMLPPFWQTVTLFNPVLYLISGFRWSFYAIADVGIGASLAMIAAFLLGALAVVGWIFRTGYRIKS